MVSENDDLILIAGPCAVESKDQLLSLASQIKYLGFDFLRGGAFKPRTDPKDFQGLGEKALDFLLEAKQMFGLKVVTEVLGPQQIELVSKVADILQIGTRNMFNYELLKAIARLQPDKTILLKRGFSATKKELLGSIAYLKEHGHKGEIIVCERGIRTFSNGEYDRFTLDVSFIADLKADKNFPYKVIVDPSHAAGRSDLVEPLTLAGISAGADGFIIEVKEQGSKPLVDGKQAVTVEDLKRIKNKVLEIVGLR